MAYTTDRSILTWLNDLGTPGFGKRTWYIETLQGGVRKGIRSHGRSDCPQIKQPYSVATSTVLEFGGDEHDLCFYCGWEFLEPNATEQGKLNISSQIDLQRQAYHLKNISDRVHKLADTETEAPKLHQILISHSIKLMCDSLTEQIHPSLKLAETATRNLLASDTGQHPSDIDSVMDEMMLLGAKRATRRELSPNFQATSGSGYYDKELTFLTWLSSISTLNGAEQASIELRTTRPDYDSEPWEQTFNKQAVRQTTLRFAVARMNPIIDKNTIGLAEMALLLGLKFRRGTVGFGELPELALEWLIPVAAVDRMRVTAIGPKKLPISDQQYAEAATLWNENVHNSDSVYSNPEAALQAATLL